ncbi:hypothetical protein MRX96_032833 [Rhipicephalus microplus]
MSDDFSGKVALVTGGAMGLGKAITDRLLQQGCRVAFIDLNERVGLGTERTFKETYGEDRVIFMKCDVTNDEDFEDCFVRVKKKFGRLDIVVNNAGYAGEERWRRIFEINTMAVYFGTLLGAKIYGKGQRWRRWLRYQRRIYRRINSLPSHTCLQRIQVRRHRTHKGIWD